MSRTDTLPAAVVAHARLRHDLLTRFDSLADDPECLADTTDGESPLPDVLKRLVWSIRRMERERKEITERIQDLQARKITTSTRIEALRSMVADALVESGMGKLDDPEFTVGTTKTQPKLVITNPGAIPEELWVQPQMPPMEIDKVEVYRLIAAGHAIDGAELTNGGIALTIRPKRAKTD